MQLTKKKEIAAVSLVNGREDCWSSRYTGKSIRLKKILKCHYNESKRKTSLLFSVDIWKNINDKNLPGNFVSKEQKTKMKNLVKNKTQQLRDGQINELNLGVTPVFQMICIYPRNDLCFHHIFVDMWSNNVVNSTIAIFHVTLNSYNAFEQWKKLWFSLETFCDIRHMSQ